MLLHIVSRDSAIHSLQHSFELNPALRGEIIAFNDILEAGPITHLETAAGEQRRTEWLRENLATTDDETSQFLLPLWSADTQKIESLKDRLQTHRFCLWVGSNIQDRLMLCRLMFCLKPLAGSVSIVPVSECTVSSKSGREFNPKGLVVLNPVQVAEVGRQARLMTQEEIDEAIHDWEVIASSAAFIRVLSESGEMEAKDISHFDPALMANCTGEFRKAARVIGETLVDIDFETGDVVLNWRLKALAGEGKLEANGVLRRIRDYEVRLPSVT